MDALALMMFSTTHRHFAGSRIGNNNNNPENKNDGKTIKMQNQTTRPSSSQVSIFCCARLG